MKNHVGSTTLTNLEEAIIEYQVEFNNDVLRALARINNENIPVALDLKDPYEEVTRAQSRTLIYWVRRLGDEQPSEGDVNQIVDAITAISIKTTPNAAEFYYRPEAVRLLRIIVTEDLQQFHRLLKHESSAQTYWEAARQEYKTADGYRAGTAKLNAAIRDLTLLSADIRGGFEQAKAVAGIETIVTELHIRAAFAE